MSVRSELAFVSMASIFGARIATGAATVAISQYPSAQLPSGYRTGYAAYAVTFYPTASDKLVGFVISSGPGGVQGTGVSGALLQRFTSDGEQYQSTPYSGTGPVAASTTSSIDSRAVNVVITPAPINADENITTKLTADDPENTTSLTGTGDYLRGIYAFPTTTAVGASMMGLYLVTPVGSQAIINVRIVTSQGFSDVSTYTGPLTPGPPEPTATAVVGFFALCTARRRSVLFRKCVMDIEV